MVSGNDPKTEDIGQDDFPQASAKTAKDRIVSEARSGLSFAYRKKVQASEFSY